MLKKFFDAIFCCFISLNLIFTSSCSHKITMEKKPYKTYMQGAPLPDDKFENAKLNEPKNKTLLNLSQAFALIRNADLNNEIVRKKVLSYLADSVSSFEDMSDPVNFNIAFSADESKDFKGRSYERVFASTMAGIIAMAENNCPLALPYFKNAEFLDARFQKMPFGTDIPLIYALRLRCQHIENYSSADMQKTKDAIFKSIRLMNVQESFNDLLLKTYKADIRSMSVANEAAYAILEISLYNSLLTHELNMSPTDLIDDASKKAAIFLSLFDDSFAAEYEEKIGKKAKELAKVLKDKSWQDISPLQIEDSISHISGLMKSIYQTSSFHRSKIDSAFQMSESLASKIISSALSHSLTLKLSGFAPKVVLSGSYGEIAKLVPVSAGNDKKIISSNNVYTDKNFYRDSFGNVFVTHKMTKEALKNSKLLPSSTDLIKLFSLNEKSQKIMGRKFDSILKGRAQFKSATETIAKVSAWSSFFLFYLAASVLSDCGSERSASEGCYAYGMALMGLAGITVLFSGTVWLVGAIVNPKADSRYVNLMHESIWMSI